VRQFARLAGGTRSYLQHPLDGEAARDQIRRRMGRRRESFLEVADRLVYGQPRSPLRAMLLAAGWDQDSLSDSVHERGIEPTLEQLRDDGVHLTLDELKGRTPIMREGVIFQADESSFDNPYLLGRGIGGTTGGSTSRPRRVAFDWAGLAEEAADKRLLCEVHGIERAPLALWLPLPPGIAGVHALLVGAKMGRPPERWFSPVPRYLAGTPGPMRVMPFYLSWAAGRVGVTLPRPEPVPLDRVVTITDWLRSALDRHGSAVLRTSASAAVRVAEDAIARGLDLSGAAVLAGGEPLTAPRREAIEASGLRAVPRYASAELGLMAGLCGEPSAGDDMHVFEDRMAVVTRRRRLPGSDREVDSLLFTVISSSCGKVYLNAELGDHAELERRRCGCEFGELGMSLHLRRVRSHEKLTGEGMGLPAAELDEAVAACVARLGGGPNDYEFRESMGDAGATRLLIAVSDKLELDEERFAAAVLDELRTGSPGGSLSSEVWRNAGTLKVVQGRIRDDYKMARVVRS